MQFRVHHDVDGFLGLIAGFEQNSTDFFRTRHWYGNFLVTCLAAADRPEFHEVRGAAGEIVALLPLVRRARALRLRGATEVGSLSNYYTCLYGPMLADGDAGDAVSGLARSLAAARRGVDLYDLDSLPAEAPTFGMLAGALRNAGFAVHPYFHFGNWYEDVAGIDFDAYMRRRPAALRNTVSRKGRRLSRSDAAAFRVFTAPEDLAEAVADYERVLAGSWKDPEPHPHFVPGLAAAAAAAGALRLGICRVDGIPAAAQIWIVHRRRATIFKLAYDDRYRRLSVGSLLTAHMVRRTLEEDGVDEIDFGRGDDPYKADWLSQRRERWGLLAFNPARPLAAAAAAAHAATRLAKSVRRRLGR